MSQKSDKRQKAMESRYRDKSRFDSEWMVMVQQQRKTRKVLGKKTR